MNILRLFTIYNARIVSILFIRILICSAEQPAYVIKKFANAWHDFKDSEEANRAPENSKKKEDPRVLRLSKQIYVLKQAQSRGQWIADWIEKDWRNWWKLSNN